MDFNNFLEQQFYAPKKNIKYNSQHYTGNREYSTSPKFNPVAFLQSLRTNRKLKIVFSVVLFFIISILIVIIVLIYSLSSAIIDVFSQNGISGLVDDIVVFLNELWNGKE